MAVERTIWLKGQSDGHHEEGILDTIAKPGMAMEMAADGKWDPVSSAFAEYVKKTLVIALEDALQGKTINDAYAVGDVVFLGFPKRGDHILGLVKAAQNIAVGDKMIVETVSGLFTEAAGTEAKYFATALESSGGALAADTLLKLEVN